MKKEILFYEPIDDLTTIIKRMRLRGYRSDWITLPEEASALAKIINYDAVLLELLRTDDARLFLPEENIRLFCDLKSSGVPLIILSSRECSEFEHEDGIMADGYVKKPYALHDLDLAISCVYGGY